MLQSTTTRVPMLALLPFELSSSAETSEDLYLIVEEKLYRLTYYKGSLCLFEASTVTKNFVDLKPASSVFTIEEMLTHSSRILRREGRKLISKGQIHER